MKEVTNRKVKYCHIKRHDTLIKGILEGKAIGRQNYK